MTYYTSIRLIDSKPRKVIVNKTGKIVNRNPSKDELKGLNKHFAEVYRPRHYYNKTNTCDMCGISFEKTVRGPLKEYNKEGNWTGKWDCRNCHQKYDPYSQHNLLKSVRNRRTGNLNNIKHIFADNCQKLTCIWLGTNDLNIENDNYTYGTPIDHSPISNDIYINICEKLTNLSGKIPQTRGRRYDSKQNRWPFGGFESDWDKDVDIHICYCMSEDGKIIDRIYILPKEETMVTGISINKNALCGWYEKYRINDEETLKLVNEIWKKILEENDR